MQSLSLLDNNVIGYDILIRNIEVKKIKLLDDLLTPGTLQDNFDF